MSVVAVVSARKSLVLEIYASVCDVATNPEISMKNFCTLRIAEQALQGLQIVIFPSARLRFTDPTHSAGRLV